MPELELNPDTDTETELQFEAEDENIGTLHLRPNQREVLTRPGEPKIRSLYEKSKRGRLVLQPDFQRQYVWDRKKASRLVDSIGKAVRPFLKTHA